MPADHRTSLLPRRVDPLARRFAPAWRDGRLDAADAAGAGVRLLRPALWLLAAAVVVQSVLHVVNVAVFDLSIDHINADFDISIDGWMGTLSTGLAAWAALQLALLSPSLRRPLIALALLCAYLSVDDMLALHEALAVALAAVFPMYERVGYTLWPTVYLPMLGLVGWLLLRTARSIDIKAGRLVVLGLCFLVVAVALEATAPVLYALGSGHGAPLYELEVTLEEALELSGWGCIALGLAAAVVDLLLARAGELTKDLPGPSGAGPLSEDAARAGQGEAATAWEPRVPDQAQAGDRRSSSRAD